MFSPDINWDALDELARRHISWRASHTELSPVYVSGEGNNPSVMLIGEAPGATEEIRRRPFVGAAGVFLRRLMASARLHTHDWQTKVPREYGVANCWLTNVVKFRPPSNRTPTADEIMSVRHLLRREWVAIGKPKVIVCLGGVSLHAIMGRRMSILAFSGNHFPIRSRDGEEMIIWPMVHPSFPLKENSVRPIVEREWNKLGNFLEERKILR